MKVVKPMKLPVLTRNFEVAGRLRFGVAAMLGFSLGKPRSLLDELSLWQAAGIALGDDGVLDEGIPKPRGELLISGACHAPGGQPIAATFVRVACGPLDKRLSIVGDRQWKDGGPSEPEPFTVMPIDWRRAFGGEGYAHNPLGKGAQPVDEGGKLVHRLPNIEPFERLMRSPSERPQPAGLLPLDVTFEARRRRAGTYDKAWFNTCYPGMPADMDPAFFNVAPEDQWLDGYWQGDESFVLEHMHPDKPRLDGTLPGLITRVFVTGPDGTGDRLREIPMRCDTVWLFPQAEVGVVIFHGALPSTEDDGADIVHLVAACEEPSCPRDITHYQQALARRLDKDGGALADLSDSDLMPPVESGVAPNIGETDVGRWVRDEGLARKNLRRGQEREIDRARAEAEAEGLDPAAYGITELPPELPELAPHDLDAQARQVAQLQARAEDELERFEQLQAEAELRAREQCEEMGVDYDGTIAAEQPGGGPPKFSAADHLQMILDNLETARDGGAPLTALEEQVCDPDYQAELIETERQLRELYRQYGHFQPPAAKMDDDASRHARVVAQAAFDSKTSLSGRDLTGADLSGLDLTGVDLSGAYLESSDLSGTNLSGARLDNAVLARANLTDANLTGASLGGANLGEAVLAGASFDRADLSDAVLSRTALGGAKLTATKLDGADFLEARLGDVDLSRASLPKATIIQTDLSGARFVAADLSQATFVECTLDGADFAGAKLSKASFVTCHGRGVSFGGAHLSQAVMVHGSAFPEADCRSAELDRANLRGTDLRGARFDGAQMVGADLSECDATGGSFEQAVLTGAMLVRTKLDEASLEGVNLMDALASKASVAGANFRGANLFRADLSRVRGDERTCFDDALVNHVRLLPRNQAAPGGSP